MLQSSEELVDEQTRLAGLRLPLISGQEVAYRTQKEVQKVNCQDLTQREWLTTGEAWDMSRSPVAGGRNADISNGDSPKLVILAALIDVQIAKQQKTEETIWVDLPITHIPTQTEVWTSLSYVVNE